MAILQQIKLNTNKNYYAKFIDDIIKKSGIDGYVNFADNTITVVIIEDDGKRVEEFSTLINQELPQSLFVDSINTYDTNALPEKQEIIYDKVKENITINEIKDIIAKDERLDSISDEYSEEFVDDGYLLLLDIASIDELFLLTPKEKSVLLSYEKPILKVAIKDEELKAITNKNFIDVKVYENKYEFMLAYSFKDKHKYLFASSATFRVFVSGESVHFLTHSEYMSDIDMIEKDKKTNLLLNILQEFNIKKNAIIFDCNYDNVDIYIQKSTGIVKTSTLMKKVSKNIIKDIQTTNGKKERLIDNLAKKHPKIYEKLTTLKSDITIQKALSIILDIDTSLSDKSMEFIGNGGLKIDMKISNEFCIENISLLSSIISYRLADCDSSLLAFSYFESFVDMFLLIIDEANKSTKHEIIITGNMLQNSVLYSRITKKMSHLNPKISKTYELECN